MAWLPSTNDENEGALGSFQQLMSQQPQLTLLNHNALAMFYKNNTQASMVAKFTEPEDYQYICMLARKSQGEEKQQRKEIVEFRDIRQAKKTAQKEDCTLPHTICRIPLDSTGVCWNPQDLSLKLFQCHTGQIGRSSPV